MQRQAFPLRSWIKIIKNLVLAPGDGILRGLIQQGTFVENQFKIGDVDPRDKKEYCFSISDKARAVSGGVLEAIFNLRGANISNE